MKRYQYTPPRILLHVFAPAFSRQVARTMAIASSSATQFSITSSRAYENQRLTHRVVDFSRELVRILTQFSPRVELHDHGDVLVDLTSYTHLWISPEYAAIRIRDRIRKELEIEVQIGISANALCAHLASRQISSTGYTTVASGSEKDFLASKDVRNLPGVGSRTSSVLAMHGITRIGDLARVPKELCGKLFGPSGHALWNLAHGIDTRTVGVRTQTKYLSVSVRTTESQLTSRIRDAAHRLGKRLSSKALSFRTVCVRLEYLDATTSQHQETSADTMSVDVLESLAIEISRHIRRTQTAMLTRVSLLCSHLEPTRDYVTRALIPERTYVVTSGAHHETSHQRSTSYEFPMANNQRTFFPDLVMEGSAP